MGLNKSARENTLQRQCQLHDPIINASCKSITLPQVAVCLTAQSTRDTVVTTIMMMYKPWIMVIVLTYLYATDNVYAAHFRGGVIMVRPKVGGAPKEVNLKIIYK